MTATLTYQDRLELSCTFPPGRDTPDHIVCAEELGFRRAWVYDSPAFYFDVWATLARAADRTDRIGLATGVAVPKLRHVVATASAVATMEALAPGRFALGVGVGFSGQRALGSNPMRWSDLGEYIEALRGLLRGETVEWDGRRIRMLYDEAFIGVLPLRIPVYVAAEGPKGLEIARKHGDGVLTVGADPGEFEHSARFVLGTVLDDTESPTSERAWAAAGHATVLAYHLAYEWGLDMSALPNAAEWRSTVNALSDDERHLVLHKGHLTSVSELDARLIPREAITQVSFTGTVAELRRRCDELITMGITELVFQPAGPDVPRELAAFARLATASGRR